MGFHYLVNLYFLYTYSIRLETGLFDGHPANYLFMLLFNWICIVIVALLSDLMLLMDPLVLSVLYVWCQLNKDVIVTFWFGTQFKAIYLPWVLLAFNMIISGGGLYELIGILVGHLYFFLMFKYPQEFGGRNLLQVPSILYRYFPDRVGGVSGFGQAPAPRRPADGGNNDPNAGGGWHNWGRGQVLGN
nr:derlin-1-like isoform X2 [Dermacentor andersoni]